MVIIFLFSTAKSYTAGQRLFSDIANSAKQGYTQLAQGGQEVKNQDIAGAQSIFEQAYAQFQAAQDQIWFMKNEPTLSKYTAVLESGQLLADSGKQMIEVMQEMKAIPDLFAQNIQNIQETRTAPERTALSQLQIVYPKIVTIHANVAKSLANFQALESDVPSQYRAVFVNGISILQASEKLLADILVMIPGIEEMMGNGRPHRTLILLQNNDEVRGTGGFIGSFINLQMENGHVTEMKLEDVYDMDGQFKMKIEPPDVIKKITGSWYFRDSNVSPDFRIAGDKALWFYAQERGQIADSVIAINQDLLGEVLGVIGPVEMTGLDAALTRENYRQALTYMIETKRSGAEDPKKILKDLMPIIQKRLFQPANMGAFQHILLEQIVQKNISGYSKNPLTEDLFAVMGMDGAMKEEVRNEDSLSVVASSFGANKSDAYMKQEITHDTVIEHDGEVYDQLTIKRINLWSGATAQRWRTLLKPFNFVDFPDHFLEIFGAGDNKVALRVYVPSGSQLISSDFMPVENIKTVVDGDLRRAYFSFDMVTKAGSSSTVKIRYKLPFTMSDFFANTYTLSVQKQLGVRPSDFTKYLLFNNFMSFAKAYPDEFLLEKDGSLMIGKPLNRDLRLSVLMTRDSMK